MKKYYLMAIELDYDPAVENLNYYYLNQHDNQNEPSNNQNEPSNNQNEPSNNQNEPSNN